MTQVYDIKPEEHRIYEREETCVFDITIRLITSSAKSNPSDVFVSLTSPSGTVLLDEQAMTNDATGEYSYDYSFLVAAEYGEYDVEYRARATDGTISSETHNLFLFRYDLIKKIRRYSGIEKVSVSDEDVAGIAMDALQEALEEVYEYHKDIPPICDPDYGVLFNGTNTVVRTRHQNIADYDFDGFVYGDAASGDGDITGYWIDSDYARHTAKIVVNDSVTGRITFTQSDDSAIPNTYNGAYLSYHVEWESYSEKLFEDAIAYLAAHHLILRMTEAHRATAADLPINQRKIELNMDRFKRKYDIIMNKISRPICDGV